MASEVFVLVVMAGVAGLVVWAELTTRRRNAESERDRGCRTTHPDDDADDDLRY